MREVVNSLTLIACFENVCASLGQAKNKMPGSSIINYKLRVATITYNSFEDHNYVTWY